VLLPNHEALVKEDEYDDYDYNQELDSGLETSGMADLQALLDGEAAREVKSEPEEQDQAITPRNLASGISAIAQPVPLFQNSGLVKEEVDEPLIKDEPDDFWDEDAQQPTVDVARHPDSGIAALLSIATARQGVRKPALFNREPKMEEVEDVQGLAVTLQASSRRRKAPNVRSSNSEDDDEPIYISHEDVLLPRGSKRGRPMGSRSSPKEVATDPKKRRQSNNRDAALRYREKKKMEAWEKKHEKNQREELNARLVVQVNVLSREVRSWKGRCLKAFQFLPDFDFEDYSPLSLPFSSRRSVSATPSNDSTSSLPSSLASPVLQSLASSLFDRAPLSAAAKSRAKKTEAFTLLKQEEADLYTRNNSLRAEALQLYVEIVSLRKKIGFEKARTSADTDLPFLLRSTEYSSTQISDFLSSTQS
ncbi:hypothetical protein PENTCL1PPCAC_28312, partial [Pristionchus entomophagus]